MQSMIGISVYSPPHEFQQLQQHQTMISAVMKLQNYPAEKQI
jgi:hypothetical protein